jgi:hypothetical protein
VIGFHSCYRGITDDKTLHGGIIFMVEDDSIQRNSEFAGDMISETSVLITAKCYKVPEGIYN